MKDEAEGEVMWQGNRRDAKNHEPITPGITPVMCRKRAKENGHNRGPRMSTASAARGGN